MNLFYLQERDKDFFIACEKIRRQHGQEYISVSDIARKAIYTETESFYLLDKEFAKILYRIEKGINQESKSQAKNEQYREIERRYRVLKAENPGCTIA